MTPIQQEKLEVLNGERGDKGRAAVRLAAVKALVDGLTIDPVAKPSAAAPTQAEHNALVSDVQKLYAAINALRIALR